MARRAVSDRILIVLIPYFFSRRAPAIPIVRIPPSQGFSRKKRSLDHQRDYIVSPFTDVLF